MGSACTRRFIPSTNLGRSAGFFGSTATRTTGLTLNLITYTYAWNRGKAIMKQVTTLVYASKGIDRLTLMLWACS